MALCWTAMIVGAVLLEEPAAVGRAVSGNLALARRAHCKDCTFCWSIVHAPTPHRLSSGRWSGAKPPSLVGAQFLCELHDSSVVLQADTVRDGVVLPENVATALFEDRQ